MKYIIAFMLLYVLLPIIALAAPPSCYPGDATAAESVPDVVVQSGGACVQWHCDIGHKWQKAMICGTWSEATTEAISALKNAMGQDKATKDALWSATFTQPVTAGSPDAALLAAAKASPTPDKVPPSGLVTTAVFAYKLTSQTNAPPTFALVGTLPLGTACDTSQKFGPYYRVDRTKVKFPTGVIMPPVTYAKCD